MSFEAILASLFVHSLIYFSFFFFFLMGLGGLRQQRVRMVGLGYGHEPSTESQFIQFRYRGASSP